MACKNFKVSSNNVSAGPSDIYQLSSEQLQSYQDNGYLVIQKLIGLPALDSYRQRFVDVCQRRVPKGLVAVVKDHSLYKNESNPEDYINKIQELLHDDVFCTYSEDPRLLHVVAQLIGEDITALNCMLINKPPGTDEHPPHQDRKQYYYGMADSKALAPNHKRLYLEMEPGDTVFFSPVLIHGSNANRSEVYRKAISCHYANSNCQYIDMKGTRQEHLAKRVEAHLKKICHEFSYVDLLRLKMKQVRGTRSHL